MGIARTRAGSSDRDGIGQRDMRPWLLKRTPIAAQRLAAWAPILVCLFVPLEVGNRERPIVAFDLLPHRHVRLDPLVLDHPLEHRAGPISGVADQSLWHELVALGHALDHHFVASVSSVRCAAVASTSTITPDCTSIR